MAIETAGQQKYADLTAKRIKSLQTGMIIWISLFCLALICSFSNNLLAIIVGIVAPDVLELKEEQLLVAKDYVIVVDADVWIYDLHHMEKVEVGKQGNVKKTLFLTEPNGKRHAILSTTKGDRRQEAFDQVYYRLHDRLAV